MDLSLEQTSTMIENPKYHQANHVFRNSHKNLGCSTRPPVKDPPQTQTTFI
jgi:hypothetical protein